MSTVRVVVQMPFGAITQSNFEDVSLAGIWDWWLCLCRLDSGSSGGTDRFRIVLVFDISQQQELKENNSVRDEVLSFVFCQR